MRPPHELTMRFSMPYPHCLRSKAKPFPGIQLLRFGGLRSLAVSQLCRRHVQKLTRPVGVPSNPRRTRRAASGCGTRRQALPCGRRQQPATAASPPRGGWWYSLRALYSRGVLYRSKINPTLKRNFTVVPNWFTEPSQPLFPIKRGAT